jgi:aspartate aminotransferase
MVQISATLAANERIRARQAGGEHIQHLAFGEAGLPVHPELSAVLGRAGGRGGYPSVAGDLAARRAIATYFQRRGLAAGPDQVVVAPGSKSLLYALLAVIPGDVVLPTPSWVSYAAQAALVGKGVLPVPVPAEAGGVPDPALLKPALDRATRLGRRLGSVVLTIPDNPTGTVAGETLLREVCALADHYGLVVIADQIYADLIHDGQVAPSPAEYLPARTVVTTGLSKATALGGYRIGTALFPTSALGSSLRKSLLQFASEVWSALPGPMQEVAAYAYAEPTEIVRYVSSARRLHSAVATALHGIFVEAGASCRPPQGGFYLYPDFTSLKVASDADQLAETLLERHGIGVLTGTAFGDSPDRLTFRVATSLLYGENEEQRWAALHSIDPVGLPWIAAALDHIRIGLSELVAGRGR